MTTLGIILIVYVISAIYLDYDIRTTNQCSLWNFLTDTEDAFNKSKFPLLILIVTLPILAVWALTDKIKDKGGKKWN